MMSKPTPHQLGALRRRMARLEQRLQRLNTMSQRYSQGRWCVVLLGILVTVLGDNLLGVGFAWGAAGVFLAGFLLLASYHGRVKESIVRHTLWHHIQATHVARLTRNWSQMPPPSSAAPEADHPFETDLNLTGPNRDSQAAGSMAVVDEVVLDDLALIPDRDDEVLVPKG